MGRDTRQRNKPTTQTYTGGLRPKLPSVSGTVHKRGAGLAVSRARAGEKAHRGAFGKTMTPAKAPGLPPAFYMNNQERSRYLNKLIRVAVQDWA